MNGSTDRAHTLTRLLKHCLLSGVLDKDEFGKKSYSKLKAAESASFRQAVEAGSKTNCLFTGMCRAVLDPFETDVAKTDASMASIVGNNSYANKVALLAWLVISDSASFIWEELNKHVEPQMKPQMLEQLDGINARKPILFEQLCSVAEAIKGSVDIDLTLFEEGHIGSETATAMASFNPALATLDSVWLRTNTTSMINLHDQLLANFDCSGSGLPAGSIERRVKCFQQFLGPAEGKVKNLNLFYCFVVWENATVNRQKDIRWISRSLSNGRGSMDADSKKLKATNGTAVDFSDLKITKRDKKSMLFMKELMSSPIDATESKANEEWLAQKTVLRKRKADYYMQKQIESSADSLQRAIEGPAFQLLSTAQQEALKKKYLEVLLENVAK